LTLTSKRPNNARHDTCVCGELARLGGQRDGGGDVDVGQDAAVPGTRHAVGTRLVAAAAAAAAADDPLVAARAARLHALWLVAVQ